jgi:2-polyprenyl-6-methoxyphenol hydroxylase-like FAD-dependent oxidoreductase
MQFRVLIVGAGPAGLIAAHALHQAGINFTILERRPDATPQLGGTVGIFPHSVRILKQLGLMQPLEALSVGAVHKTNIDVCTGKVIGSSPLFSQLKDMFVGRVPLHSPILDELITKTVYLVTDIHSWLSSEETWSKCYTIICRNEKPEFNLTLLLQIL